ncbi:hypothetical protein LSAT2_002662 [Lamellibrachia satsuma]|nr:hypothetical protein LSAT2_002662 [Lamellibrachia satsuma]
MNKRIVPENAQRPSPFGVCAQMAADDKWEDESLIVVELSGIIEQDWIQNIGNRCKIVFHHKGKLLRPALEFYIDKDISIDISSNAWM